MYTFYIENKFPFLDMRRQIDDDDDDDDGQTDRCE